jgi:LacI family transcriptional regulator
MKITIKDIAKALEISTTTVSKAMNDYSDISNETKKKVKEYAEKIGYEPNIHASFLRTKKTKLIGIVVPNLNTNFYSELVASLIVRITKNGYLPIVLNSAESEQVESENLERLMRQKVDGIFISLTKETTSTVYLTKVMSSSSSLITFSNTSKVITCNKVVFNDKAIIKRVTEYLINKGNSKIAFIRKSLISQNSINQFIGYREAHEVNKISIDNKRIVVSKQGTLSEGYRIAKELFNSGIQIDGFISYNDPLAIGAMTFYKENGSTIPNDIRFIGQENSEIGTFFTPELSSIKQNLSLMAEKIMRLFLEEQAELKQKKISPIKREEIKAELIERASSI